MAKTPAPAGRAPADSASSASETIRVRATAVGYYDEERKRIGDVFTLKPRTGPFTKLVIDETTGKPKLAPGGGPGLPTRLTTEEQQTLSAEAQFNPKWMERVDPSTPERVTTGNEDLKRKHDETLAARMGGGGTAKTRDSDRDVTGGDD